MANDEQSRLLELQMKDLKETYGIKKDASKKKSDTSHHRSANAQKIAKLYEDAAEYEEELKCFEEEYEIIKTNEVKEIPTALTNAFPKYEGNYVEELKAVLAFAWTNFVEVDKSHPQEQLNLIKETEFTDAIEKLNSTFVDYKGDFEQEIRTILVTRWEMLIAIKKEHVKEELAEMKLRGMKPDHIRGVYKKFHGIA